MKKLLLTLCALAIFCLGCKKKEEDTTKPVTYIFNPAGLSSTIQYHTRGSQLITKNNEIREVTIEDRAYPGVATYLKMTTPKGFNIPSTYGITIKSNSKVIYSSNFYQTDFEGTRSIIVQYQFTEEDFK